MKHQDEIPLPIITLEAQKIIIGLIQENKNRPKVKKALLQAALAMSAVKKLNTAKERGDEDDRTGKTG